MLVASRRLFLTQSTQRIFKYDLFLGSQSRSTQINSYRDKMLQKARYIFILPRISQMTQIFHNLQYNDLLLLIILYILYYLNKWNVFFNTKSAKVFF